MRAHNGTHALRVAKTDKGVKVQKSIDPCGVDQVDGLEDDDFADIGDDDLLALLGGLGIGNDLAPVDPALEATDGRDSANFQKFMDAVLAGNKEIATQLLSEHYARTGEGDPADAPQDAERMIASYADNDA